MDGGGGFFFKKNVVVCDNLMCVSFTLVWIRLNEYYMRYLQLVAVSYEFTSQCGWKMTESFQFNIACLLFHQLATCLCFRILLIQLFPVTGDKGKGALFIHSDNLGCTKVLIYLFPLAFVECYLQGPLLINFWILIAVIGKFLRETKL